MAISIDRLSIWEIAHRWHNVDPSHSKTVADIPLEVKDTLRNLAAEVYYEHLYSDLSLEREAKLMKPVFKRNWPLFWKKTWYGVPASHYAQEFHDVMNNRIDPDFLQSITVPHWELEYWCKEYQIPFPDFWVRSLVMGGTKAPFPGAVEFMHDDENEELESRPNNNIASDDTLKSEDHQRAAYQRHEPVNQLKRECVEYAIKHQNYSNRENARRFYKSLPVERRILSPDNATRTLSQAISDYKKRCQS